LYLSKKIATNIMAKATKTKSSTSTSVKREKKKISRPGVHSKTKTSRLKQSKNYKKRSRGQG
jgi:preprotein translocase subunit SecD